MLFQTIKLKEMYLFIGVIEIVVAQTTNSLSTHSSLHESDVVLTSE